MYANIAVDTIAFCSLVLGLIVLLKNRGNFTNSSFGIFAFTLALWLVVSVYSDDPGLSHNLLLWLNRISFFLPGIGLYFLLLFTLRFTRFMRRYFLSFSWLFGLVTLVVSFISATPVICGGVSIENGIVVILYGPYTLFYEIFISGLILAICLILLISLKHLKGSERARTKIMAASLFLSLTVTLLTNLIFPAVWNNYDYVLFGLLSTFLIVAGFAYAIIRHRLFDIRAVVARSVAYLLLLATLGGGYALITFRIGGLLFESSQISTPQQTFNVFTALVLVITFQPLKRLFEKLTDKVLYRDRYEPDALINQVSKVLASEIGLVNLSRRVRLILMREMRIDNVNIVVLNNNQVFAEAGHYVVSRLEDLARDLGAMRGKLIVSEEMLDDHRKEILQQYGVSVVAVLHTKEDKRIGYLLYGEKLNGDIYTETDLRVIRIIADQLAVAIQNAKAYVQIQRFNHTLQSKVTDATKQLREANASLQQLDNVKDEFISVASHQLRTPLTIVDGYLSNLIDGIYGPFNSRQKKAIELTHDRLRLTVRLVADLLNLSRMEAGKFIMDPAMVDLSKIIKEEVSQLKIKAAEQKIKISYIPPADELPLISLDEQKTRQAIMNLIDNAIIYGNTGDIIKVSLRIEGYKVVFEVIDHGIGVPKAEQDKLFSKFFRASNAKKHRAEGTGIGLYLVKRVIEEQGGSILFSSKENEGSVFGFSLLAYGPIKASANHIGKNPALITARKNSGATNRNVATK